MAFKVGELFVLFGISLDKPSVDKAKKELKNVAETTEKSFKVAKKEVDSLRGALHALSAVGTILSIGKITKDLFHLTKAAGEEAVHIKALSEQMGITAEQTQEWGFIAEQAGSNVDELSIGFVRLSKNLRAMHHLRDTQGTRALREIGINVKEARAALNNPDAFIKILFKISAAFEKIGNTARRAGLSNEIFGRQAKSIVSDLSRGPAEIKHLIESIRERGSVIPNEQIETLSKLGNRINNITQELRAFAFQAVALAAPSLFELIDASIKWVAANKDVLQGTLKAALKGVEVGFKALSVAVKVLAAFLDRLLKGDEAATALFITMAAVLVGLVAPAFGIVGAAIWTAFAPLLPFAAIIFAVAAVVLVLVKRWKLLKAAAKDFVVDLKVKLDLLIRFFKSVGVAFAKLGEVIVIGIKTIGRRIADLGYKFWADLIAKKDLFVQAVKHAWAKVEAIIAKGWSRLRNLPGARQFFDFIGVRNPLKDNAFNSDNNRNNSFPSRATRDPSITPRPVANIPTVANARSIQPRENRAPSQVSVGPTTINLYGVKGAEDAQDRIADSIDTVHRHAAASLGGEVQ